MRWPQIFLLFPLLAGAFPHDEIRPIFEAKQHAWNRGDIDAFMSAYLRSPDTTFIGASGIVRGYDAILERYRRNYPTRDRMGQLTFTIDEVRPLTSNTALLLGRFALDRSPEAGGPASGRFTLIWLRTSQGWRIVHDHTSP